MSTRQYRKLVKQAEIDYAAGNYETAATLFEEAFIYRVEIDDYISYGFVKLEMDKMYEAEIIFKEVISELNHPSALFGLAVIDSKMGRIKDAIDKYEQIINLNIDDPVIYKNSADLYDDIGNKEKAIEYYLKSIEHDGEPFWPYTNIGAIYEEMDQNELALSYLLKAYEINPNEKIISYNLGVIYGKLNKYDLAIKYYLEDLQKEEHNKLTYFNLALAYKDGYNDLETAKKYYLLGLKDDQDNYLIWYNLGCLYVLMDNYDDALECFTYLKYKSPKYLKYIQVDSELEEFRKSEQYQRIIG